MSASGRAQQRAGLQGPWWLNWTTVRGAATALAGVLIIALPPQERLLAVIASVGLVAWAAGELFTTRVGVGPGGVAGPHRRGRRAAWATRLGTVVVLVLAGALLLVDRAELTDVVGAVVALRGLLELWRGLRSPDPSQRRTKLVSAGLLMALGLVVVLVPATAALALRAGIGVGALALGGILLSMGLRRDHRGVRPTVDRATAPVLLNDWLLRRRLRPEERAPLVETLFFEPPHRAAKLASFWVMMVLATGIASFAVVQDSTAVVIGAMLVAPLMTPIMGVSAAAVNGWAARLVRSLALVVVAALAAVLIAWLIASWLPSVGSLDTNSQITSRVEPSLLDFCIAVFAGAAGAYATVDPRVSSSLSGVAIAVALVPPLSVVGITLQEARYELALGAGLLFLTNVVSIVLAAVTVFVLVGFALLPPDADQRSRLRRVTSVFGAGALVILVPLSFTSQQVWTEAYDEGEAAEEVDDWLEGSSVELVSVDADGRELDIVLTGPGVPEGTDTLVDDLEERLGYRPEVSLRLLASTVQELD